MPKLSDTMEEGKILRWLKHPGDEVHHGERWPRSRPTRPTWCSKLSMRACSKRSATQGRRIREGRRSDRDAAQGGRSRPRPVGREELVAPPSKSAQAEADQASRIPMERPEEQDPDDHPRNISGEEDEHANGFDAREQSTCDERHPSSAATDLDAAPAAPSLAEEESAQEQALTREVVEEGSQDVARLRSRAAPPKKQASISRRARHRTRRADHQARHRQFRARAAEFKFPPLDLAP